MFIQSNILIMLPIIQILIIVKLTKEIFDHFNYINHFIQGPYLQLVLIVKYFRVALLYKELDFW